MSSLIRLENITKEYKKKGGSVFALNGISLEIVKGEYIAITGSSGSGKTTVMNILGCLDTPSSGKYYLNDECLQNYGDKQLSYLRSKTIGFVFQSFNLISELNCLENVELPLCYRGISARERRKAALCSLEAVGLSDRLYHKPCELSGGQQQRAAIARALSGNPELILADEPTGNLDYKSRNEIMSILDELNQQGKTVVMITHDSSAAKCAGRIIQISDGKIVC